DGAVAKGPRPRLLPADASAMRPATILPAPPRPGPARNRTAPAALVARRRRSRPQVIASPATLDSAAAVRPPSALPQNCQLLRPTTDGRSQVVVDTYRPRALAELLGQPWAARSSPTLSIVPGCPQGVPLREKKKGRKSQGLAAFCSGQSRDRTGDLRIFSPSL